MKSMKCYGRKQAPKEKSFIRNFFDGNESSEVSLSRSHKEEVLNNHLDVNKENVAGSSSSSSGLFDNDVVKTDSSSPCLFDEVVFEKKAFEKSKCFGSSTDIQSKQVKKKKCIQQKKVVRGKPKGIQHLSTKFCKSHQPRWSEINSHAFTVEGEKGYIKPAFTGKDNGMQNRRTTSYSKYSEQNSSVIDSCKKFQEKLINRKPSILTENDLSSSAKKTKMCFSSQENLDSSSDLFRPSVKVRKTLKVKKSTRKKNSKLIHKKGNRENFLKSTENALEEKINQCMELANPPIEPERSDLISGNFTEKKSSKKLASRSSDLLSEIEDVFCQKTNPPLLVIDKRSSLKDKLTCDDLSKISVPVDINAESGSLLNNGKAIKSDNLSLHLSEYKKCAPVNDLQNNSNTKQNCIELDRNLNKDSERDILQINNSIDVSENIYSKENLNVNASNISQPVNDIKKKSGIKSLTINSRNLNANSLGPMYLNESCKLNSNNFSSDLKCIQSNKVSELNSVTGKAFQNVTLNTDALSMFECFKIKESSDISKLSVHCDKNLHVNISPNVSLIENCWKSSVNQPSANFLTSTPVIKNKFLNSLGAKLPLFSHKTTESSKDTEENEKQCYNLCLHVSTYNEVQKSFVDSSSLIHSKKSSTLPKVNLTNSVSLKRNSSLLNVSSLPYKEDSHQFTCADLLKLCDQDDVAAFADVYNWKEYDITKIGEGSFGEVFLLTNDNQSVLKVIPVSEDPNNKDLQGLASVYSEIKVTQCLSGLRTNPRNQTQNYTKLNRVSVVSGVYPAELITAWDQFNQTTYNARPDIYCDVQLFVILELEYGGKDLSHIKINNSLEAESILKQIAISLAIAEEEFSFEHRDLHLGNILINRNKVPKVCSYKLRGQDISFPSRSVRVIIIDFTLSLLHENGFVYYHNLAEDVSLFEQSGDYQFEVYRDMRNHLQNKWQDCSLYSNILWLKYLCIQMKDYKYKNDKSKRHKEGLKAIDYFNNQLSSCNCALECLALCGITEDAYRRRAFDRKNSILVSRSSIQRSKLSICN